MLNPDGSYSFDPSDEAYASLGKGDSTTLTVPVTVTDEHGAGDTTQIRINVQGTNDAPVAVSLSASSVVENAEAGTLVANLAATDVDAGDTFTYELVEDASGLFEVVGDQLLVRAGADIDYETAQSHGVSIKVTDASGASHTETVHISVSDIEEGTVTRVEMGGGKNEKYEGGEEAEEVAMGGGRGQKVEAGGGDDSVTMGEGAAQKVFGGEGDDRITMGDGKAQQAFGGEGDDTITMGGGEKQYADGGAGDDTIIGGDSRDKVSGGVGDDTIDGGTGTDTAVYRGRMDEYEFSRNEDGSIVVHDNVEGRDGTDTLYDIELLQFRDQTVSTDELPFDDTIRGSAGDDRIEGTEENDVIEAMAGDDVIHGLGGSDTIDAGAGDDEVHTLEGDDVIDGGSGNDELRAGGGDDSLSGGTGSDALFGEAGADSLSGGAGNDQLYGGAGDDTLSGGAGADRLVGGAGVDTADYSDSGKSVNIDMAKGSAKGGDAQGDIYSGIENVRGSMGRDTIRGDDQENLIQGMGGADKLYGRDGDDMLQGGGGNDQLYGDAGDDTLLGGAGNDLMFGGAGADHMDGGEGSDTVSYSASKTGVEADLGAGGPGGDTFTSVENLIGSGQDDVLTGDDANNRLVGGGGDDRISGGGGKDTIRGGQGEDVLDGGAGRDTLDYSDSKGGVDVDLATGQVSGGFAEGDVISNFENVAGSKQGDTLSGTDGDNTLDGNQGDDQLAGGAGNDWLIGDQGADTLDGGSGNDVLRGGDGADVMHGGEGIDTLDYADSKQGVNVNLETGEASGGFAEGDRFSGMERVTGGRGDDIITGDEQNNYLRGKQGDDTLSGGEGRDSLRGEQGDDVMIGGAGDDVLRGDAGEDTAVFSGNFADYRVVEIRGGYAVKDLRPDGDGTDKVYSVENFQFADGVVKAADLIEQAPTDVVFSSTSIADGSGAGTVVATLQAVDENTGDSFHYELVGDGVDQFEIVGDTLVVKEGAEIDFEQAGSHTITVQVTDSSGLSVTKEVTIEVSEGQEPVTVTPEPTRAGGIGEDVIGGTAGDDQLSGSSGDDTFQGGGGDDVIRGGGTGPTDIGVSSNQVSENAAGGTVVATLRAADADSGDSFTYTLSGDASGLFEIVGDELRVREGADIDFESQVVHEVTIEVADGAGHTYSESFGINVVDVREAVEATIKGKSKNDDLRGGDGDDVIDGGAGNDDIAGEGGDDLLLGGTGNDELDGGAGNDLLDGGEGNDQLAGGEGDDLLSGGDGNDRMEGGAGDDTLLGGAGNDRMEGGEGGDLFRGGAGNDQMHGGGGDDSFYAGDGHDKAYGDQGNDAFFVDPFEGSNYFHGGHGEGWTDVIHINADAYVDAAPDSPWSIEIDGEQVQFDIADHALSLNPDTSGVITFADGSELTFDGVERIEW
ncbi:MAG: hypothetical protein B0D94_08465 [Candidatus Sedimenticola endophacoides]|nr:MAG: hypothetical protein B0D94_08465 [Candidatus Sedimenticola endophacoides]